MLEETLSYYKSKLKHAEKSGPQFVTVADCKRFLDENGKELLENNKHGIVITFKNDNIEHEELYFIGGRNYKHLQLLKKILGIVGDELKPNMILGDQCWIVIRHNITIDDKQNEVKREAEIVHYSADEQMPNYPQVFESYDIAANA